MLDENGDIKVNLSDLALFRSKLANALDMDPASSWDRIAVEFTHHTEIPIDHTIVDEMLRDLKNLSQSEKKTVTVPTKVIRLLHGSGEYLSSGDYREHMVNKKQVRSFVLQIEKFTDSLVKLPQTEREYNR